MKAPRAKNSYLKILRRVAFVGIFLLTGIYASLWLRGDRPSGVTSVDAELVKQLPAIELDNLAGARSEIADYYGKPLMINFWATWCGPCLREMPMFEQVWLDNQPDNAFTIIGIAVDRREDVDLYLEKTPVTYPILIGQTDAMAAAAKLGPAFVGLPFTVFATSDGAVMHAHSGEIERPQLDYILAMLQRVDRGELNLASARELLNP